MWGEALEDPREYGKFEGERQGNEAVGVEGKEESKMQEREAMERWGEGATGVRGAEKTEKLAKWRERGNRGALMGMRKLG